MKFEKLNLNAFSKERLTDNSLRSVSGGFQVTLHGSTGNPDETDLIFYSGETYYSDSPYSECDVEHN